MPQVLGPGPRGDHVPVLAVVGPLRSEVFAARMVDEFSAPVGLEVPPYHLAPTTEAEAPGRCPVKRESPTRVRDEAPSVSSAAAGTPTSSGASYPTSARTASSPLTAGGSATPGPTRRAYRRDHAGARARDGASDRRLDGNTA